MKISIFIINFNNAKLLKRAINSVLSQTYSNKEIIVYDDGSVDGSKKVLNKFRNVKKVFLKKKKICGTFGQINGIKECLKICRGNIICFLDSDDFFHKNKLKQIANFFRINKNVDLVLDQPIFLYGKNKKIKKKYFFNKRRLFLWPKFSPQSCISVRSKYLNKYIDVLAIKKFEHIWFDFRISIIALLGKKFGSISSNLTFYQQGPITVSSKYSRFSKLWWIRRKQAFDFIKFFNNGKILPLFFIDYLTTLLMNFFLRK